MLDNKRLKNLFRLDHKVSVYIPATINVNENIDNSKYVNKALELMSNSFGGATSYNVVGAWTSEQCGLVKENTTIVYSNCTKEDLKTKIDEIIDFCESLKLELNQEAIALEIDNELYFI